MIVARLHPRYLAGIHILLILQEYGIVDRLQRHVIKHLSRLHHQVLGTHLQVLVASLQLLHGHHGLTAFLHRQEVNHSRGLVFVVVERLHRYFREEGQRALAPHHRVGNDVERIVIGYERTQVQACHVFDRIFIGDAISQFLVSTHLVAQCLYLCQELRVRLAESRLALFRTCIQKGAIRQDDTSRHHHPVAVGMDTTVHARSIVDDDTTHHCRAYRGRVRREHPSIRLQDFVHPGPDDTRLELDGILPLAYLILLPVLTRHNEHAVGTALTTQRSTCRTKGEGQSVLLADLYNLGDFLLAITANHDFGNLSVETGIRSPSKGAELIGINTVCRKELLQFVQEIAQYHK